MLTLSSFESLQHPRADLVERSASRWLHRADRPALSLASLSLLEDARANLTYTSGLLGTRSAPPVATLSSTRLGDLHRALAVSVVQEKLLLRAFAFGAPLDLVFDRLVVPVDDSAAARGRLFDEGYIAGFEEDVGDHPRVR